MSQVEDVCGEPCECGCGLLGGTCDDCLKEGYMECSECGETVPNNLCEFVDEDMECCMCLPCAKTFRQWEDDFENKGAAILCAKMRPYIAELLK
jgi:hypothetical protein